MSSCNSCNKNIFSNAMCPCDGDTCYDACVNASCGDPKYLTLLAPVVYDEIGTNVCRSINICEYINTYPGLAYIDFQPLTYTVNNPAPTISQIANRPNCFEVTISNLNIVFLVKIYDCCKKLLGTEVTSAILYLPPATDPSYNAKTNPSSVSFEIFAPYGISYENTGNTPALNILGFSTTNNFVTQGLNLIVIPKVVNLDTAAQSVSVGLSLILSSVYFSPYLIPHNGKAPICKGETPNESVSACKKFVEGSLLDRNIKPLEFGNPADSKENCEDGNLDPCDDNSINDIFE